MDDVNNASPQQFAEALAIDSHEVSVPEPVRISAVEFLVRFRSSPAGLRLAFDIIATERYDAKRVFWALNALIEHIPNVAPETSPEAAAQLYDALQHWIQSAVGAQVPDFILAKHAQTAAVGMQAFFPGGWSKFYTDLFAIFERASSSTNAADEQMILYFLRVWHSIHFAVADPRTEAFHAQRDRNNFVKDQMRQECIPRAVYCWYTLLMKYAEIPQDGTRYSYEIPRSCLELIAIYAEWIDIDLLLEDRMVQLYYGYMRHVPHLRDEALEAISRIVDKGQLPELKLKTVARLLLVERLPAIVESSGPLREDNERFVGILSKLIVVMLQQLLQINAPDAERMGHSLIPVLLRLLHQYPLAYVREIIVPMLQDYVKLPCASRDEVYNIASTLFSVACTEACDGWICEGTRQAYEELEKHLYNVFRLIHRKAPDVTIEICGTNIQRLSSAYGDNLRSIHHRTAEASMRLLYEMGECFRADLSKLGPNHRSVAPFAEMTLALLTSHVLDHEYPPLHQLYFEVVARYYMVVQKAHDDQILVLLKNFLFHDNGVQHRVPVVRDKICYLFNTLLHQLKPKLLAHCNHIVVRLKELLSIGRGSAPKTPRSASFSVKNKGDLFEILGLLLAMTDHSMMRGVFEGIVHDITEAIQHDPGNPVGGFAIAESTAVVIGDNISFVTSIAKGIADGIDAQTLVPISPELTPQPAAGSQGLFPPMQALPPPMVSGGGSGGSGGGGGGSQNQRSGNQGGGGGGGGSSQQQQQQQKGPPSPYQSSVSDFSSWLIDAASRGLEFPQIRERSLLFLQQVINVIGTAALPFVRKIVGHTIDASQSPNELTRAFRAFAHSVNIMRSAATEVVGEHLLPRALSKMMSLGQPSEIFSMNTNVMSEIAKEMLEVYKNFYQVLNAIVTTSCIHALKHPNTASRMGDLMMFLMATVAAAPETDVVKSSLSILQKMFHYFSDSWPEMAERMHEFFFTDIFSSTCEVLTRSNVNVNDAKVFFVVGELTAFVRDVTAKSGPQTLDRFMHFFCKLGLCTEAETRIFLDKVASLFQSQNPHPSLFSDTKVALRNLLEIMGRNRCSSAQSASGGGGSGMNTPAGSFFEAGQNPRQ